MSDKLLTHSNIKPFRQFGFSPITSPGNKQVIGDCIFCITKGRKPSFYVNVESQAWDCKRCGKSGGIQKFLETIWEESKQNFRGSIAKTLSKDRGLKIETLVRAGIGYHKLNKSYILPILDYTGDKLHSLKLYKKKKLYMTSGISNLLYQGYKLEKGFFNVFLCEGEWDCLALNEALRRTEKKSNVGDLTTEIAVSVPGANTFKKEWLGMFQNANVTVLYDNDKAGNEGAGKVYNYLKPIVKLLNFYHWGPNAKSGEDMRDVYTRPGTNPKSFFSRLKKRLKPLPMNVDKLDIDINIESKIPIFKYNGPRVDIEELHKKYSKYLLLNYPEILDVIFATMISNRDPGIPIWLFLVAPSGGGKSELIMSLDKVQNVTSISSLTTNTLISGMETKGGGDPSLIPKLNGRVLTIKDYTTIFGMGESDQAEISSQLRDAFDGKAAKPYGNGQFRVYESTFGIISGVTPAIETFMEGSSALGERFIRFRLPLPDLFRDEILIMQKALNNNVNEKQLRKDLSDMANRVLAYDYLKDGIPPIPKEMEEELFFGALFVSYLRGTIPRNRMGQILQKPNRELGTRLTKQYGKLLGCLALIRGRNFINRDDFNTLRHVYFSCIPEIRADIIKNMYLIDPDRKYTIGELSSYVKINKRNIEINMEDLLLLKMVKKNTKNYPNTFHLSKHCLDLLNKIEVFKYDPKQSVTWEKTKTKSRTKSKRRSITRSKKRGILS